MSKYEILHEDWSHSSQEHDKKNGFADELVSLELTICLTSNELLEEASINTIGDRAFPYTAPALPPPNATVFVAVVVGYFAIQNTLKMKWK